MSNAQRPTNGRRKAGEEITGDESLNSSKAAEPSIAVGRTIRRLRQQHDLPLQELAEASGLSASFLSAVERGHTDIALNRLARVAEVFNHDLGSFLGYTMRKARPQFAGRAEKMVVDRGKGVSFTVFRPPGAGLEFLHATFEPRATYDGTLAHEGSDIVYVVQGEITLVYDDDDYVMKRGDLGFWPGGHPHMFRNHTNRVAAWVGVVTELVF